MTLTARGVSVSVPHAQHIHIGGQGTCPDAGTDTGTDELIDTVEGQPAYGPIKVSLTTEGDVTPSSGLAVDRFPTADAHGAYTYTRSFPLPEGVTFADVQQGVVVVHGNTALFGDAVTYDGSEKSPLDESLPLEATIPVLCGKL